MKVSANNGVNDLSQTPKCTVIQIIEPVHEKIPDSRQVKSAIFFPAEQESRQFDGAKVEAGRILNAHARISNMTLTPTGGVTMLPCMTGGNYSLEESKKIHKEYNSLVKTYSKKIEKLKGLKKHPLLKRLQLKQYQKSFFAPFLEFVDACKAVLKSKLGIPFSVKWSNFKINQWLDKIGSKESVVKLDFSSGFDDADLIKKNLQAFKKFLTEENYSTEELNRLDALLGTSGVRVLKDSKTNKEVVVFADPTGMASQKLMPICQKIFPKLPVVGVQGVKRDLVKNGNGILNFMDHAEVVFMMPRENTLHVIEPMTHNKLHPLVPGGFTSEVQCLGVQNSWGSTACVTYSSAIADLLVNWFLLPDSQKPESLQDQKTNLQHMLSVAKDYDLLSYMEKKRRIEDRRIEEK